MRTCRILLSLLAIAPLGFGSPSWAQASSPPAATKDVELGTRPTLRELLAATEVLLLGEVPGSQEVPTFVLQAVTEGLGLGNPVVLALPLPRESVADLRQYFRSSGDEQARTMLLATPFWRRERPDGRSSEAMLALIEGVRLLIGAGADVTVVCYDIETLPPGTASLDQAMARHLLREREKNEGARFIVLARARQARTSLPAGRPGTQRGRPMGWYLDVSVRYLRSLQVRYAAGEFWLCNPDCRARPLRGQGSPDASGVELFGQRDAQGFDGVFDIGAPTAALPAVGVR